MLGHASCELVIHEAVIRRGVSSQITPHTLVDCADSQINTPTHRCRRMESQMVVHEIVNSMGAQIAPHALVNGALDVVYIGIFV